MTIKSVRPGIIGRFGSLKTKLVVAFVVLGVVPALTLGWYSYRASAGQLREAAGVRLEDAAVTDGDMIDRNLFERYGDVQAFAANPMALGSAAEQAEIIDFLTVNYGIYDIMMIVGLDGRVSAVNSVDGEGNAVQSSGLIGSNVSNQDWFKVVASGNTPAGGTYYTDVEHSDLYTRVYGGQKLGLPFTAPIYGPGGDMVAIWHNEASFERIVTDIMAQRRESFASQGLQSVETQVLRADGVVLDDADHNVVLELNLADVGLQAAKGAIGTAGSSGSTVEKHVRRGVDQINGFAATDGALGFEGYGWGILVRQDSSEASAPANAIRSSLILFGLVILGIVSAVGMWLARGLSLPLMKSVGKLEQVSAGDLGVTFDVTTDDEVGQMSTALNTALGSIGGTLAQVDQSATDLTGSANHLTTLSREMSGAAAATSDQANEVAAAAEEISATSDSVARAMEQMNASVREISDSTADAARMSAQAVEVSTVTKERMQKLDASASDIGNVVSVITSIAEQTDLLALNATIEAARVGEAGKGFAVVANEVKALASQTSNATEEIHAKIEAIQNDAVGAVKAIAEISDLIDKVNETSTTIAGAVEEQSATTAEVSSSIQAVTDGTTGISETIAAVAQAAETTTTGAATTLDAADHLSALASELTTVLTRFTLSPEQHASVDRSNRPSAAEPQPSALFGSAPTEARELPAVPQPERRLEELADDLVNSGWR